jgi:hypothetical protein
MMQARQKRLMEAYRRVLDFLAANPPVAAPANFAVQRQVLDEVVGRLRALSVVQIEGQKEALEDTQRQASLRTVLRNKHLAPIAKIARVLLTDEPGVENALRLPHCRLSTTKLVAEAIGIRRSVTKFKKVFVDNGRPADFLAQLDTTIEKLQQSELGRMRTVGRQVGATAGMEEEIARGRKAVELLDVHVLTVFEGNEELIAKWKVARRVQNLPGTSVRTTGGTADENLILDQQTAA